MNILNFYTLNFLLPSFTNTLFNSILLFFVESADTIYSIFIASRRLSMVLNFVFVFFSSLVFMRCQTRILFNSISVVLTCLLPDLAVFIFVSTFFLFLLRIENIVHLIFLHYSEFLIYKSILDIFYSSFIFCYQYMCYN